MDRSATRSVIVAQRAGALEAGVLVQRDRAAVAVLNFEIHAPHATSRQFRQHRVKQPAPNPLSTTLGPDRETVDPTRCTSPVMSHQRNPFTDNLPAVLG